MSKMIRKQKKKQIANDGIYEEFWIQNVYIFLEKYSMIFFYSLIKYLFHKIKENKNLQNFITSTDRRNWKENVKNNKKIKNM